MALKKFTFEEIKALTDATFKMFDVAKASNDPNDITAEIHFLNMFVETLVSRALNNKAFAGESKENQLTKIRYSFGRLKYLIQEATALGFQEPMKRFSGMDIDYSCTITPVQEPKNTLSN